MRYHTHVPNKKSIPRACARVGEVSEDPDANLRRLYAEQHKPAPTRTRGVKVEGGYVMHPDDRPRHAGRCSRTWKGSGAK